MAQNIVLIGMMGCGKTTVGRLLAQRLECPMADTDALIEERTGRTIPDIFAADGEARFRALELELCRELAGRRGLVVACGGGLPLQDGAISALKENGLVFWLDRDPGRPTTAWTCPAVPWPRRAGPISSGGIRTVRPSTAAGRTIPSPAGRAPRLFQTSFLTFFRRCATHEISYH